MHTLPRGIPRPVDLGRAGCSYYTWDFWPVLAESVKTSPEALQHCQHPGSCSKVPQIQKVPRFSGMEQSNHCQWNPSAARTASWSTGTRNGCRTPQCGRWLTTACRGFRAEDHAAGAHRQWSSSAGRAGLWCIGIRNGRRTRQC